MIYNQSEMDEESENYIQLVKAREDSSETLQATKQSLHLIALFVYFNIVLPRRHTICFWWHHWNHPQIKYQLPGFILFVRFIHNHVSVREPLILQGFQKFSSFWRITGLTRR